MPRVTDSFSDERGVAPFSVEILSPNRGDGLARVDDMMQHIRPYGPAFVSVTYHQSQVETFLDVNGPAQVVRRKKPGSLGVCAAIRFRHDIEAVPHVICGGFARMETEDFLVDIDYLGIDNVLALRGDPQKGRDEFEAHPDGHRYASELTKQVVDMNHGIYVDAVENPRPTNFCIGVAGYPDKHVEASDLEGDIQNLAHKVDQGADYIITQMCFDSQTILAFIDTCRDAGIEVPIVPGLKVISSSVQATRLPDIFHVPIPDDLASSVKAAGSRAAELEVGIAHAVDQCRELLASGVPDLHLYSMNRMTEIGPLLDVMLEEGVVRTPQLNDGPR